MYFFPVMAVFFMSSVSHDSLEIILISWFGVYFLNKFLTLNLFVFYRIETEHNCYNVKINIIGQNKLPELIIIAVVKRLTALTKSNKYHPSILSGHH